MEDDEAVEEGVVLADALGHGGPVACRDGGRVEEGGEFEDAVADVAAMSGGRRAERVDGCEVAITVCLEFY